MIPPLCSGFAHDIREMMGWRGTIGYTEACYSAELKAFDKYCASKFPDDSVLTWDIAVSYLTFIRQKKDVRTDVIALRNLGKYQKQKGLDACVFPTNYFSYKKRRLPYIMSDDELQRFFDACDNYPEYAHNPLLSYTCAVLFRLQYATGMRPSEPRHLTRKDFDFHSNTIYIANSKRHKDRIIAVSPEIMVMCRKYDTIARTIYPGTEVFFPTKNGKEYTASLVQYIFNRCWKMACNPTNTSCYCSPYILRHNFATRRIMEWLYSGKDFDQFMPYLSSYMGHQTFKETCYYLHLLPERLSKLNCMNINDVINGGTQ